MLRLKYFESKIIITAVLFRIVIMIQLPNFPSPLGPDEGTYASLVEWIAEGNNALSFGGFGPELYFKYRAFILPSIAFSRIGVESLQAVRMTSSIYGLLSIIVFIKLLHKVMRVGAIHQIESDPQRRLCKTVLVLFTFMPSFLLWSSLGLRETTLLFWLMLSFLLYLLSSEALASKTTSYSAALSFILFPLVLAITFSARNQVAVVFTISLFFSIMAQRLNRENKLVLFLLVSIGSTLGALWARSPSKNSHASNSEYDANSTVALGGFDSPGFDSPGFDSPGFDSPGFDFYHWISQQLLKIGNLREGYQEGASSAINLSGCQEFFPNLSDQIACNFGQLPAAIFSFLFRPMILIDSTSTVKTLASIENLLWSLVFLVVVGLILSNLSLLRETIYVSLVFFLCLFTVSSSFLQGNLGTSYRHKSILTWLLLLLLVYGLSLGKSTSAQKKQ